MHYTSVTWQLQCKFCRPLPHVTFESKLLLGGDGSYSANVGSQSELCVVVLTTLPVELFQTLGGLAEVARQAFLVRGPLFLARPRPSRCLRRQEHRR